MTTKEEDETIILFSCTLSQAIATRNILQKYSVGDKPPSNVKLMLAFNSRLHQAITKQQGKQK